MTAAQSVAAKQELDRIVAGVREQGMLPDTITTPPLRALFAPVNQPFLAQADAYAPAAVAARLPPTLPALVLHGTKDQQVVSAADAP